MALTQAEYEQLYNQIRQDVLKELEQKRVARSSWTELRKKIDQFLSAYYDGSIKFKYLTGFSALIRLVLDVRRVENIKEEQIPIANEFLDELFELIEKYKADQPTDLA